VLIVVNFYREYRFLCKSLQFFKINYLVSYFPVDESRAFLSKCFRNIAWKLKPFLSNIYYIIRIKNQSRDKKALGFDFLMFHFLLDVNSYAATLECCDESL